MPLRLCLLLLLLLGSLVPGVQAQDSLTQQALGRIAQYEQLEADLQAGDRDKAGYYLNQLGWAAKRLNAVSDKTESHWKDAQQRYAALVKKIEAKAAGGGPKPPPKGYDRAQLDQLNKEIGSACENLKLLSVKHLADASRVSSIRRELSGFVTRLEPFPAHDEDVQRVTANLADFRRLFEAGLTQLAGDQAASGGVSAGLEALRVKYASQNQPDDLTHPFSEPQLRAWAAEMRRWREQELPRDSAWLEQVRGNAAVDQQQVSSLHHWLSVTWQRRLDEVEQLVRERVASDVLEGQRAAEFVLSTALEDPNHVLNRILGKGRFDEQMTWLRQGEHGVAMARVYDEAMGSEAPEREAQAARIAQAIAHLKQLANLALEGVRLPEPASTDPELLRIAAETLRRPEYAVAGWERLVIRTDKTHHVRREAWLAPGSSYLTLSYYEYAWDQFQVTTAEKVGDELWLFANLLKCYESGDPTTPVGKWILSQRFELTPILPQHLGE